MKSPCGFGKKYFTLSSIQAHSVQISLDVVAVISKPLMHKSFSFSDKDEDDPPDMNELNSYFLNFQVNKPCHCNCYYKKETKKALLLSKKLKRCLCHSKCFSFRRSGIHPPLFNTLNNF